MLPVGPAGTLRRRSTAPARTFRLSAVFRRVCGRAESRAGGREPWRTAGVLASRIPRASGARLRTFHLDPRVATAPRVAASPGSVASRPWRALTDGGRVTHTIRRSPNECMPGSLTESHRAGRLPPRVAGLAEASGHARPSRARLSCYPVQSLRLLVLFMSLSLLRIELNLNGGKLHWFLMQRIPRRRREPDRRELFRTRATAAPHDLDTRGNVGVPHRCFGCQVFLILALPEADASLESQKQYRQDAAARGFERTRPTPPRLSAIVGRTGVPVWSFDCPDEKS